MKNWESIIKANPIEWLLEQDTPSVRYFTLIDLLGKSENNSEVRDTKSEIMKLGVIPKILEKQKPEGYWGISEDFYMRSKYKGTVWSYLILAQLGTDGNDERIKNTSEFILQHSQDPISGGFSVVSSKKGCGLPGKVIPCLTGNMIWSLIRFGYLNDHRVQKGISWITNYQRFDDGTQNLPKDYPYKSHKACFSKHSCHMGVVKILKALAEIPRNKQTTDVKETIDNAVDYLLLHHIYKRSHNLSKVSKPGWLRLGFPHMYQTDILEILDILTKLGIRDERMQDAVDIVISKQNDSGQWSLENTFNGRFQANIETKGQPSKWITLSALRMLQRYYS